MEEQTANYTFFTNRILNKKVLLSAILILALSLPTLLISCGGPAKKRINSVEEQFAKAKKLYDKRRFFRSSEEFQKVIYNFPGSNLVDTAQYYLSMSYMDDKQYALAAVEFERLIKNYPRSGFTIESRYRIGYCFFKSAPKHAGLDQTELKQALKLLDDFIIDYPESEYVSLAQATIVEGNTRLAEKDFQAAIVYVRLRSYFAAEVYFQRVIDLYGETKYTPLAVFYIGESRYKLKQWDRAAEALNTFAALYPEHEKLSKVRELLAKVEAERDDIVSPAVQNDAVQDDSDSSQTSESSYNSQP